MIKEKSRICKKDFEVMKTGLNLNKIQFFIFVKKCLIKYVKINLFYIMTLKCLQFDDN